jgi:hypothetical protein
MFRIIKYIFLFFLGYKFIKMLFPKEEKIEGNQNSSIPKNTNKINLPDDSEFVEYEEVK